MKGKVLITGGTGYIGSHTILALIASGYEVVCVDNGMNSDVKIIGDLEKLAGQQIPFYNIDLCDYNQTKTIFRDHKDIVGVVHFAALKAVGESTEYPIKYFKNNLNSLLNVLSLCIENDVKGLIFSSSCTVYGDVAQSPVDENTPWQDAASPYGRTKQMGEQIIVDSTKNSGLKCILLRYFNPAGAHPSGLIGESPINPAQNLVPVITETAAGLRKEMTVFGTDYPTRDGSCVRDYIHVMDLADAHVKSLDYILTDQQESQVEVFNVGIGEGLSVLEIIKAFEDETGVKLSYKLGDKRPGDVMAIFSDYTKAKNLLGWSPKRDVKDIVRSAWTWEKSRRNLTFKQ